MIDKLALGGISLASTIGRRVLTTGGRIASLGRTLGTSIALEKFLESILDEDVIAAILTGSPPKGVPPEVITQAEVSLAAYGIVSLDNKGMKRLKSRRMSNPKPLGLVDIANASSGRSSNHVSRSVNILKSVSKSDSKKTVSLVSGSGITVVRPRPVIKADAIVTSAEATGVLIEQMLDVIERLEVSFLVKERKDIISISFRIDDVDFMVLNDDGNFYTECGLLDSPVLKKSSELLLPLLTTLECDALLALALSGAAVFNGSEITVDVASLLDVVAKLDKSISFGASDAIELISSTALLCIASESQSDSYVCEGEFASSDQTTEKPFKPCLSVCDDKLISDLSVKVDLIVNLLSNVEYPARELRKSNPSDSSRGPLSGGSDRSEYVNSISTTNRAIENHSQLTNDLSTKVDLNSSLLSNVEYPARELRTSNPSDPSRGPLSGGSDGGEYADCISTINRFIGKYGHLQIFENPSSLANVIVSEVGYSRAKARDAVVFAMGSSLLRVMKGSKYEFCK